MFDDGSLTYIAEPRPVGHLHGGMCPCTLLFVQRDRPKAGLGPAVAASLEAQPGKHLHQTVDVVRPRRVGAPVVGWVDAPPRAGIAGRERDAVIPIRGGSTISNPWAASLGNKSASSSVPSDASVVPAPTQPSLLDRCDVAVVGRVDRVAWVMACSARYQCPPRIRMRFRIRGTTGS